ncbi:hypothetical protein WHR41_02580 [Cladosporium halotolerans]|uniref:C6 finger domain-containing protein n=1 Tax=Cladosporium halotolerans TaxID=1052096 RepID=A0AB34L0J9_9PEZI
MENLDFSQQDALLDFTAAYLDPTDDHRPQSYPSFAFPHQPQLWHHHLSIEAAMENEGLSHPQHSHHHSHSCQHPQHQQQQQQQQHTPEHHHSHHHQHQYLPHAASSSHHRQMLPQQSAIPQHQQQQQPHSSRPSSNHAHPAQVNNLQTAGLNMDYSTLMPTDWQFQFQQAAAFQAQQQQQQQHQAQQQQYSPESSSLPLNTYNLGAFSGQLQASPVDFMPVSASENYAAATTGISANGFMSMAGPMESMNALAYPLNDYQNDLGNSFSLSLQNALNQHAADSAHSSVPGSSPTGTILEVQSLSDNEWSAINFNPHRQSLDSFSGTVSNPSQNLHIRTNSDSSSDGPHSASYLSGSYEEIPPWPLSSPHDEFHSQDYIDAQYLQSQGFGIAQERGVPQSSPTSSSSLAVSPTAGIVALSYASAGSSSTSPTSSGPTSPPLRRRKSPSESTAKVTKAIVKKSPTSRKDSSAEKKIGRRRGPLRPDQRQQAHEIRKLRACLRCKFLKKTCDKGEPCGGCRPSHARLWQVPCTRLDIKDIGYFMKDWKADYERHVSLGFSVNNIKGFSTMERTLYITHGYGHYLPINAREVFVREDKCFDVDWVESQTLNQYELTTAKLSAGMEGVSTTLLSEYLDRHLDQGFENFVDDYFEGTAFITEILKTAYRYYEKEKTPSIRKALKLVLAYNLTVHITMVEGLSDEEQFVGRIDDPDSKFSGKTVAPVMINFQVKCALADMWRELQKDILEELSSLYSSVYSGDKLKNWPTIFMLAAILLAIWEEMQFDCHYRVPDEQAVNKFCDDMETTPVGVIVGLFQAISTKLPGLQEWDTSKHHNLLGSNPAICDALTEVKGHVNKYETYLKDRQNAKFDRDDFDSLSGKFLSKLVIRAN